MYRHIIYISYTYHRELIFHLISISFPYQLTSWFAQWGQQLSTAVANSRGAETCRPWDPLGCCIGRRDTIRHVGKDALLELVDRTFTWRYTVGYTYMYIYIHMYNTKCSEVMIVHVAECCNSWIQDVKLRVVRSKHSIRALVEDD